MSATITVIERATVARINEEHHLAMRAYGDALAHAIEAGRLLADVKGQLRHGEFMPWVEEHFDGSDRTARVYMQLAAAPEIANRQTPADLSIEGALRQVSKPRSVRPDRAALDASLAEEFGGDDDDLPAPASRPVAALAVSGAAEQRRVRRARELWREVGERLAALEDAGLSDWAKREEANAAGVASRRLIAELDTLAAAFER